MTGIYLPFPKFSELPVLPPTEAPLTAIEHPVHSNY